MRRFAARAFVGIVGLCHAAVLALFAYFALLEHDKPYIARPLALVMTVPFVLLTAPSLYLAFRTRYWIVAAILALCGCVAGIVLWRTA